MKIQIIESVLLTDYRKVPKFSDTKNNAETTPKFKQKDLSSEKLCPKCVDGMASSVDPDQTAPLAKLVCVDPSLEPQKQVFLKCSYEPRYEKTGLRGFQPGPTQTGLYNLGRRLEA